MKRWIGREVKRFLIEADTHLPFLLRLASAPIDLVPGTVQEMMQGGVEEMELEGDEFQPTDEEIEAEKNEEPVMIQHAEMWDRFRAWVRCVQEPWTQDDDDYRDERALEYFNHALACSRDVLKLKPTLESWVPHIACFVVPRQIRWLGRSANRAADACESYGALVKDIIKHRTCRRRVKGGTSGQGPAFAHTHTRATNSWKQTFTRGYIEQAFRRCCVKEKLLHGEENQPYLQRHEWKLKNKGVKKEKVKTERAVPLTVRSCVEAEMDLS